MASKTARVVAPSHLMPGTQRWYREICATYELEAHHKLILQAACESWDRAQQARQHIAEHGLVIDGKSNPAVAVEQDARTLFVRCVRELNLDAAEPPDARPPGIHNRYR